MERAAIDSYEIYKQYPEEAFTLHEDAPLSVDEEMYDTWVKKSKERVQLRIKNEIARTFSVGRKSTGKNKGIKKKTRGRLHSMENRNMDMRLGYDREFITTFLRERIGNAIVRETYSNLYVLCPHHKEKTASCCISKTLGMVKCFGCGRSHTLPTFLSMTLGNTRKFWQDQLDPPSPDPNQLKIEFPEEKTPQ